MDPLFSGVMQHLSTPLVIGPAWSSDQLSGNIPLRLTRPYVGFSPTTPQKEAGILIDPPVSEPVVAMAEDAAMAAAEPPLDPPGIRFRSHGLRVGGVDTSSANS